MYVSEEILTKIANFNCKGLKSPIGEGVSLHVCESHAVIFLTVTWLQRHDMHLLPSIKCEFYGDGISSIDATEGAWASLRWFSCFVAYSLIRLPKSYS